MTKSKLIAAILCTTAIFSCSKGRNDPERKNIQDLAEINKSQKSIIASPLVSAMDDINTPPACTRLKEVSASTTNANPVVFSYLATLNLNRVREWQGRIDVEQSPFTQLFLGEKFALGTTEEFYKKAKEEYEAGRLSYTKWMIVKIAYETGIGIESLQLSATNSKLEEAFPGIFGKANPMVNALYWKLANKIAIFTNISNADLKDVLTKKMPLFPGDGSWDSLADSSRISIASAAKAFRGTNSGKEKLCASILLHQNFAQLLRLKGYHAPVANNSKLNELSHSQKEFPKKNITGAFINMKTGKSIVLENENISNYDPSKKLLGVVAAIPTGSVSNQAGSVNDALAFMEALVYSFEGTSPVGATALKSNNQYLLGDILNDPHAILPSEAHSLALGLLTMNFKNLAALHIRKIDLNGAEASEDELQSGKKLAAGILLTHQAAAQGVVLLKLDDALRFARVTSYLENSLNYFLKEKPEDIEKLNPVYNRKTLESLFGKQMFPEEDLPASLLDNLQSLRFPVALLLSQLGTSSIGCASEMEWNLVSGERKLVNACSNSQKAELADIFELMGRAYKAPILLNKAKALRENH